jgi:ubiquinone/menaquinone biosynthesis C-methylase UbiE
MDVLPGDRVLDVACGSGNTAIAAARYFAEVTGIDFVPALLERGRVRAAAELLEVEFVEGDAPGVAIRGTRLGDGGKASRIVR